MGINSILLISDFDGTLTKRDTTYISPKATKQFREATPDKKVDLTKNWIKNGETYYTGFVALLDSCLIEHNEDFVSLEAVLSKIDFYNLQSRENLVKDRYFEEMVYDELEDLVDQIEFQPCSKKVLEEIGKTKHITCKILSLNWFPELLHAALEGIVHPKDIFTAKLPVTQESLVCFNQVSGGHSKRSWIKQWKAEMDRIIVYLGDSLTDILALLEATYGIVVGTNENLLRIIHHFHIKIVPLSKLIEEKNNKNDVKELDMQMGCLYATCSWEEIEKFIMSL